MKKLCNLCPRNCNVNRDTERGFCNCNEQIKISKVMLHHFEEPIISGTEGGVGSGAIFFSSCNLRCVYCQNHEISQGQGGRQISVKELSEIFKALEARGAYNINLVTPTHYTAQIIEALKIYRPKIPIVWNSSGYEKPETIEMLAPYVDIFLADFKYFYKKTAKMYSFAENYPEFCKKSLILMRKIIPKDIIEDGLMKRGLIVRHLVLPNHVKESVKIIDFVHNKLGRDTIFSLMSQYVPCHNAKSYPEINRKITPLEYKILLKKLQNLGMCNSYIQDLSSASTDFTPDFKSSEEDISF